MPTIEQIPDYAAIKQIVKALWKTGEVRGAAVMVGAGFSRFAALVSASTPVAPLWADLSRLMASELYPHGVTQVDPLMLAQEYRSTLGSSALENLVRSTVRDKEWLPGELHSSLLRLPWEDVLTTNWDTLLEREAAQNPDRPYETVLTTADIARARRPRIVKLHGSLPSYTPFVLTEEDFRTYPVQFAPFVNTAQQVLLENELSLLGFSGEDPNFLKWAGWVRDKLGVSARPIRLVGVLDLSPSRRRLLEDRNITPVDLAPLVQHLPRADQHRAATQLFLEALWAGRPKEHAEWKIEYDSSFDETASDATEIVTSITNRWQTERQRHPGWLVTPRSDRTWLEMASRSDIAKLSRHVDEVAPVVRAGALYEAVWRCQTMFEELPSALENALSELISSNGDVQFGDEQRVMLRASLTAQARRRRDWLGFDQRVEWLEALQTTEAENAALYERCLRARDSIDLNFLAGAVGRLKGADPVWLFRIGALQAELGRPGDAARTFAEARLKIRKTRANDKENVWLLSREAWANLLVSHSRDFRTSVHEEFSTDTSFIFGRVRADPLEELREISEMVRKGEKEKADSSVSRVQGFDAGNYTIYGRNLMPDVHVAEATELRLFMDFVGLPLKVNYFALLKRHYLDALALAVPLSPSLVWQGVRVALVSTTREIDRLFGRNAIAAVPLETINEVVVALKSTIEFAFAQRFGDDDDAAADLNGKLSALLELLSRFSVRLPTPQVRELLRYATNLFERERDHHRWHLEPFDNLFKRLISALGPDLDADIARRSG